MVVLPVMVWPAAPVVDAVMTTGPVLLAAPGVNRVWTVPVDAKTLAGLNWPMFGLAEKVTIEPGLGAPGTRSNETVMAVLSVPFRATGLAVSSRRVTGAGANRTLVSRVTPPAVAVSRAVTESVGARSCAVATRELLKGTVTDVPLGKNVPADVVNTTLSAVGSTSGCTVAVSVTIVAPSARAVGTLGDRLTTVPPDVTDSLHAAKHAGSIATMIRKRFTKNAR
jgi:hypothetical protein